MIRIISRRLSTIPPPPRMVATETIKANPIENKKFIFRKVVMGVCCLYAYGVVTERAPMPQPLIDYTFQYLTTKSFPDRPFIVQNRHFSNHLVPLEGYYLPYNLYPVKRGVRMYYLPHEVREENTSSSIQGNEMEMLINNASIDELEVIENATVEAMSMLQTDFDSEIISKNEFDARKENLIKIKNEIRHMIVSKKEKNQR